MTPWEYFADDPVDGADFLEIVRRGTGEVLLCTQDAVMMREPSTDLVLLHARSDTAANVLIDMLPPANQYAVHGDYAARRVAEKTGLHIWEKCYQACYLKDEMPKNIPNVVFEMLGPAYEEIVVEHYGGAVDGAYARERFAAGVVMGAFADGELAGFIGAHAEGSMGMLEVFPAFRRRHIGFALEAEQIRRFKQRGIIPFCHVFDDNAASLALQKKLGMAISGEFVYWLFKE